MAAGVKYDMTVYPVTVQVRSASDGARVHNVTLPSCDCADFINRKGQLSDDGEAVTVCKHILAALARVGGWHRDPEPAPVVHSDLSRERARTLLAEADVPDDVILTALRRVVYGQASLIPAVKGEIRVEVINRTAPRAYQVTIPRLTP